MAATLSQFKQMAAGSFNYSARNKGDTKLVAATVGFRVRELSGAGAREKPTGGVGPCCVRGVGGAPAGRCAGRGSLLVVSCLGVSLVCVSFSPRWRCCFAVWLWSPGLPRVSCVPSCPLGSVCGGRASLVPGSSACSLVPSLAFPSVVLRRRRVCLAWLRACGVPSSVFVGWSFALPFPSVLAAGRRSGALRLLLGRCFSAAGRRARAGLSSGGWLPPSFGR